LRYEKDEILDNTNKDDQDLDKVLELIKKKDIDYLFSYSLITKTNLISAYADNKYKD